MSGGQGYIGSKISLISRSDIRYVGVLHNINSEDSTVALENVQSFGTEGRRGNPSEEIPPSDNVFEYIVFRGSDIKDLQVFEPPAPKQTAPAQQQYPNDPAIMNSNQDGFTSKQPAAVPAPAPYTQAPYYTQNAPTTTMVPPTVDNGVPVPMLQESQVTESVTAVAVEAAPTNAPRTEVTSTDVEQLAKSVSGMNVTGNEKPAAAATAIGASKLPGTGEHLIKSNNRGNRNSRVNVRYSVHGNANNTANNNANRIQIPNSDFDFETSNAKFNKDSIIKEVTHPHEEDVTADQSATHDEEEVIIPPADDYYNKTKSFFDNISCEAKERSEQGNTKYGDNRRSKFHEERKLNVETFGQASVDQGRHRGYRGRGGHHHRGGRGRGGYRGGRGGYNNSNNSRQQSTTA
ncbi:Scd6-like Sm domain-containing protein [Umbelopsis sp. PMI_123]|nr:Scd6-like Sm domain-containing protein [Umbelopsis sp. PMI_123]